MATQCTKRQWQLRFSLHGTEGVAGDIVVAVLTESLGIGHVGEVPLGADDVELAEELLLGSLLDGSLGDGRIAGDVL